MENLLIQRSGALHSSELVTLLHTESAYILRRIPYNFYDYEGNVEQ